MGHRYFSDMPPMFEIHQDRRQHQRAVEGSFHPLGRAAIQDNNNNSYPPQNVMMGEAYWTSHMHMGGWPNGHFPSNSTLEAGHVRSSATSPFYNPLPRLPSAQSYYLPSQNYSGHVHGGNYDGHPLNEFRNNLANPVMNIERVSFKRKRDAISAACERDSESRFYCAGSSSSSAQFQQEKACFSNPNHPSSSFPRNGGLSIGNNNRPRNVRSRSGVNLEANNFRSQLQTYPSHHYGSSSHPSSHSVRIDLDPNSSITNPSGLPTNSNGRFAYLGNNRLISETSQHLAVRNVTDNEWHGRDPNLSRNLVLPQQYLHGHPVSNHSGPRGHPVSNHSGPHGHPVSNHSGPHGHPVSNISGPHGHPVSNCSGPHGHPVSNHSGSHFTSYIPPNMTNLSQYHRGHQVPHSENGLQFPGTSRFSAPASVGSWHNHQRDGRSRRFQSLYNSVDAQNSLRSQALISVDQSYLYNSANLYDQYGDMRLDIDHMTYEELLALEERIGNVNTGLSEDAVSKCLMEAIHGASDNFQQELACAICLEEYEDKDKIGTLKNCGHVYHACCIKKWLLMKNSCPVCKASAFEEKK